MSPCACCLLVWKCSASSWCMRCSQLVDPCPHLIQTAGYWFVADAGHQPRGDSFHFICLFRFDGFDLNYLVEVRIGSWNFLISEWSMLDELPVSLLPRSTDPLPTHRYRISFAAEMLESMDNLPRIFYSQILPLVVVSQGGDLDAQAHMLKRMMLVNKRWRAWVVGSTPWIRHLLRNLTTMVNALADEVQLHKLQIESQNLPTEVPPRKRRYLITLDDLLYNPFYSLEPHGRRKRVKARWRCTESFIVSNTIW